MYIKKRTGKGFLDSLQEKNSVKTVGVMGSCKGDGVTTLSIAMANYLAEIMSMKTAVVECNDTKAFEIMKDLLMKDMFVDEVNYTIGKVTYFFGVGLNEFFATYANCFEYVIIDFGSCFREYAAHSGRLKYKIVLGSVMPYKSVYHKQLLDNMENTALAEHCLHLLHGDEKNVKEYSSELGISALTIPVIANPYIIGSKLTNFFQLLF